VPLTESQERAICAALAAIPSAYTQHDLDTSSTQIIAELTSETPAEETARILNDLRERGLISPVLTPRGGDDRVGDARVYWTTHV
jgi:hypothetical protein